MMFENLKVLKEKMSPEMFAIVLEIATDDIKFNKVSFNKCTSPSEFLAICERCYITLCRC